MKAQVKSDTPIYYVLRAIISFCRLLNLFARTNQSIAYMICLYTNWLIVRVIGASDIVYSHAHVNIFMFLYKTYF